MAISVFDDALLGPLFADRVAASAFGAGRMVARFNAFEIALAEACAAEGLVSAAAAEAVVTVLRDFSPDLSALAEGSAADGLPVPAYVRALRGAVGDEHAAAAHFGATSQDVMDTARALALAEVNDALRVRLEGVVSALRDLSGRWGGAPLMGRTRMQAALPLRAGERIGAWLAPFADHRSRLARLREGVEALQLGGPVGNRSGFRGRGDRVAERMARDLRLHNPPAAWHTRRDHPGEYASFLSLLTAACGKIGQDVVLMAQQGIEEVALPGGGSSAMAHKNNPVAAEILVTLARFNAAGVGAFHQALVHEQERSGISWSLEWMILPQMCAAAGRALETTRTLLEQLRRIGPGR